VGYEVASLVISEHRHLRRPQASELERQHQREQERDQGDPPGHERRGALGGGQLVERHATRLIDPPGRTSRHLYGASLKTTL
jgi:hypothetical protein